MCLRLCVVLHALCGVVYTGAGSVLMVAGIFFFISTPFLQLGSNMLAGGLCIVFGVGTVILTCCAGKEIDTSKVDKLMSCTLFVLAACVANIVILEFGEWWLFYTEDLQDHIKLQELEELAFYGHVIPSLTTCAVIALAFLDAQFLYCTNNIRKTPRMRHIHINETVSDIEYIIPRHKSRPLSSKQTQAQAQSLAQYTQSWVFDTEGSSQADSPYLKLSESHKMNPPSAPMASVQVECGSDENADAGRQLNHMKSFSRSRIQYDNISEPSSSASVSIAPPTTTGPIYECLEKLTQPSVYKSRLDSYRTESRPSSTVDYPKQAVNSSKTHDTLMAELGRSRGYKQAAAIRSPGSDAEFSKELEAALKLIQDLESPNTIDSPPGDSCGDDDASSKTISGHSSFDGKQNTKLPVESESTSGYNSPSLSDRGTTTGMSCVIRQVGPTAVISIFPTAPCSPTVPRSVARPKPPDRYLRNAFGKVRGFLTPRRPSLLPDLERAVLKSESLAFLSDGELKDRLLATREVHRRIEEKVKRDMSLRKWDSFGSIEDIMDYKKISEFEI